MKNNLKAIFVPGNGGDSAEDRWRPWLKDELGKLGIPLINIDFPDPVLASMNVWLPFIKALGADENTILIGHSSGAEAAMRYAEEEKIFGTVLIGACHTDLGLQNEKDAGYYDEPWQWDKIKNNQKWIIQFHSTDDPFIPIEEARFVHENLNTEYFEYQDRGHFGDRKTFPELIEVTKGKIIVWNT
jgi:predicted alpha/beta hydrolase family esterase